MFEPPLIFVSYFWVCNLNTQCVNWNIEVWWWLSFVSSRNFVPANKDIRTLLLSWNCVPVNWMHGLSYRTWIVNWKQIMVEWLLKMWKWQAKHLNDERTGKWILIEFNWNDILVNWLYTMVKASKWFSIPVNWLHIPATGTRNAINKFSYSYKTFTFPGAMQVCDVPREGKTPPRNSATGGWGLWLIGHNLIEKSVT